MKHSCIENDDWCIYLQSFGEGKILLQDMSTWVEDGEVFIVPDSYTLKVLPPASSKEVEVSIDIGVMNDLSKQMTIKDGIYCFTLEACGKKYSRTFGLFPSIECCLARIATEENYDKIAEVNKQLLLTKASIKTRDTETAKESFKLIQNMVESLDCDCGC